jgi:hypothetical protein
LDEVFMQHPDEGTIHAWLDGALPPAEQAALADHVMQCPECGAAVAEARGMIAGASRIVAALDVVRGGVLPRVEAKRGWSAWRVLRLTPARAAIAATLMVAVASMLAIRHKGSVEDLVAGGSGRNQDSTVAKPELVSGPDRPPTVVSAAARAGRAGSDSTSADKKTTIVGALAQRDAMSPAAAPPPAPRSAVEATKSATVTGIARRDSLSGVTRGEPRGDTMLREAAKATAASPVVAASPAPVPQVTAPRSQQTVSSFATPMSARLRTALADNAQPSVTGCYRISNDSGAGTAHSSVPLRFALQHAAPAARSGPVRNVALSVTPAGQVDTLEHPGVWQPLNPNTVSVSWTPAATLTMTFGPAGIVGELPGQAGGIARRVEITRMDCVF